MQNSISNRIVSQIFASIDESVASEIRFPHQKRNIQDYIQEIIATAEALLGKNSIEAVALFGSAIYDVMTHHSDIDLLIIVSNSISKKEIRRIEPFLGAIEIKHNFAVEEKRLDSRITHVVNEITGMFCSHFICRLEDWNNQKFSHIFNTSPLVTKLLAPEHIVLESMKKSAQILYGKIELNEKFERFSPFQLIKSLIMCLILAISSIFILPINYENMKYCLEAYKWSLRSCCYYLYHEAWPLHDVVHLYKRSSILNGFLLNFLYLRKHPWLDLRFALRLPWQIIKLHILTMKYKRCQDFCEI